MLFLNIFLKIPDTRLEHLKCVNKILNKNGIICYIGIPYFKETVNYYIKMIHL